MVGCVGVVDAPGNTQPGDDQGGDDDTGGGTPTLNVALDKDTIPTELGTSNVATLTLTGSGGFSGAVTVSASVVNGAGAAIAGWTVALDTGSVTLAENGTATVKATVKIPSLKGADMAGTLKFDVSGAGVTAQSKTSAITAADQVTLVVKEDAAGKCIYPTADGVGSTTGGMITTVAVGTTIHWVNMSNDITNLIIHNDSAGTGLAHESQTAGQGTPMNQFYSQVTTGAGTEGWYCHGNNNPNGNTIVNGITVQ